MAFSLNRCEILAKNTVTSTMDLLQWKFQIDFRPELLNQYISENASIIHFRLF